MFLPNRRNVISAILILAECYPCSENIAGTINQSFVRSFVIESRITSFSRVFLGPARRPRALIIRLEPDSLSSIRHSSVFSRRILLYLPLVPFCSHAATSFRLSHAVLWKRRDSWRNRKRMGDSRRDKDDQVEE